MVVGVIGTGNMGSALVKGWLRSPEMDVAFLVWDKLEASVKPLVTLDRVTGAGSLDELVTGSDVVLVAVKPKDAPQVLSAIAHMVRDGLIVVSCMAGITLEQMRAAVGPVPALFRIMPNLGVALGAGAVAIACERTATVSAQTVMELAGRLGYAEVVSEAAFDAVTAVSGSGPAFIAILLESLEDGAVAVGLPRPLARTLVRQTALATAMLLPLYEDSPARLREHMIASHVVSPSDLKVLDDREVRLALQRAVEAAVERSGKLRGEEPRSAEERDTNGATGA